MAFENEDFIRTMNQNMQAVGIRLDLVQDVIRGLYRCKFLWKLDLHKGYRHLLRASSDWPLTSMFIRVRHPISGQLVQFSVIDPTMCMGLRCSGGVFCEVFTS